MNFYSIDGDTLRNMFISGVNKLNQNRRLLDSLNVFPVPDGDTGTNMSLTAISAAREIDMLNNGESCSNIMRAASDGSLKGARGNSGVILSQLFRGMAKAMEGTSEINVKKMSIALLQASATAFKAVMKPKEGTILTVAREVALKAEEIAENTNDIAELLKVVIEHANETVHKTTGMIKTLKEAGVVDAGGKGYALFIEGMFEGLFNKVQLDEDAYMKSNLKIVSNAWEGQEVKYIYCTEFLISTGISSKQQLNNLKSILDDIGDSLVIVNDESLTKVHVHTNNPGTVLEAAIKIGDLSNIKIENMKIQHTNSLLLANEIPDYEPESTEYTEELNQTIGIISVSPGDGFTNIFKDLGVDYVVEGGQSMNPSIEQFLEAIKSIEKDNIIILPNNANIVLAAEQSANMFENKNIKVLPTHNVPQAIIALSDAKGYDNFEEIVETMSDSIPFVKTGLITKAVRDTVFDGKMIKEGDYLGIIEDEIFIVSELISDVSRAVIDSLANSRDLITIYYGMDISTEDAESLAEYAQNTTECEIDLQSGGQSVYYYIISAE